MKNTTKIGMDAEAKACEYLIGFGYKIIERNYRNRFCEVDIICQNNEFICLVEVKYRKNDFYGGGFGAINYEKQKGYKEPLSIGFLKMKSIQIYSPELMRYRSMNQAILNISKMPFSTLDIRLLNQ